MENKYNRFPFHTCMTRGDLHQCVAIASMAVPLLSERLHAPEKGWEPGPEARVALAGVPRGATEDGLVSAVRQAAETATDFSWLSRGDNVLIKPAVNSGNPYPATTHPACVKAMITLLKEKGAKRVVISDMSGIEHVKLSPQKLRGSTRDLMMSCGVAQAAAEAGAEMYFPEEEGWHAFFEDDPVSDSNWKAGIMMPKILREVDHIVLLPRCSRHALVGATLGMKAAVGYWRTDSRLEYHHDAATLQEKTAEANTVSSLTNVLRLTLTVADRVQATFGPDKGYVLAPANGLIYASESIVAHDMISLAWLLESRKRLPQDHRKKRRDPYSSQLVVNIANRWIVNLLGGVIEAAGSETLLRNDLKIIWDDRVLRRSFQVFGGVPQVALEEANPAVPPELIRKLAAMITTPSADGAT